MGTEIENSLLSSFNMVVCDIFHVTGGSFCDSEYFHLALAKGTALQVFCHFM